MKSIAMGQRRPAAHAGPEASGTIEQVMVGGNYSIKCDNGFNVLATLSNTLKRTNIRIAQGEQVVVELHPYNPTRGMIVHRSR